jgi:hypothetical protein
VDAALECSIKQSKECPYHRVPPQQLANSRSSAMTQNGFSSSFFFGESEPSAT